MTTLVPINRLYQSPNPVFYKLYIVHLLYAKHCAKLFDVNAFNTYNMLMR